MSTSSGDEGQGPPLVTGVVLLLATVLPALVFVGLSPILPQIEAHFRGVPGASLIVRSLVSVVGPAVVVGAPLAGLLAGRFGERRVLIWASALFGLAGCAAAVLDNLYAMLASRIVLGLAVAATSTITTVILTKLYVGQARNRWLGYYGTVGGLITVVLIPACGFLGAISWRLVFLSHALAFPLILAFLVGLPKDPPRTLSPQTPSAGSGGITAPTAPVPWGLIALGLACGCINGSAPLFLPFRLAALGVTEASKMGLMLLPAALAAALSALAFGPLRARLSASATFALAFGLAATGLLAVSLSTSLTAVFVGILIMGVGGGLVVPNLFAVTSAMSVETDRSRLLGFTKGAYFAGPLLSQLALEPVAQHWNPAAAILLIGLFGALLSVWSIIRAASSR